MQSGRWSRRRLKPISRLSLPRLASGPAGLAIAFVGLIGLLVTFAWMADLSKLKDLERDFAQRVTITYAYSDGAQMRVEGDRPGPLLDTETLPSYVPNAVLAAEDHRFYEHGGFVLSSILRAGKANLTAGDTQQGGSTITQQLVKNTYGDKSQTLGRKLREIVIASEAERYFRRKYGRRGGKNRILSLYMSRIELGFHHNQPVLGFEDAALRYYNRRARDLTLGQSALIAGMLLNWNRLNPLNNYPEAKKRRDLVLGNMWRYGFIDEADYRRALATDDLPVDNRDRSFLYLVDELRPQVNGFAQAQDARDDIWVNTTLDSGSQRLAASIISRRLNGRDDLDAAMVALDATGAVRILIGARDYGRNQFDIASRGRRPLASTLKPFVYEAALLAGGRPGDTCLDTPLPENYGWPLGNAYSGGDDELTLYEAFAKSSNRVAARLGDQVGRARAKAVLDAVGFRRVLLAPGKTWVIASAGAPLDLAAAYLAFASARGERATPFLFDTFATQQGKVLKRSDRRVAASGLDPDSLRTMRSMMRRVMTHGTGRVAAAGVPLALAGKTGTSDDHHDGWIVVFGQDFVIAVWVGWMGPQGAEGPEDVTGAGLPSLILNDFLRAQTAGWVRSLGPVELSDAELERGQPFAVEPSAGVLSCGA
ncbi:penicillin-binding protein 1A [Caulobacter ginsengisoli]|uniref:peptidoglycan glycosyltransferase n=1 Tax=Caulobacter ginsengisoli TaxID=400775 RepID=A0ABU0IWI1_9CAUL|nr:transglycosylase domain-containing protein [Caulobacter ginsengisoli]MDQ0465735.1 penicillin-binding protein 1A [Caulobacter ginsengisoli]